MTTTVALWLLLATAGAQPRGMVLDFSAKWCGPCQRISPLVSQLEREGLPIRKVDLDEERALANKYNVTTIPTFILVVDGREQQRVVGAMSEADLRQLCGRVPKESAEVEASQSSKGKLNVQLGQPAPLPRCFAETELSKTETLEEKSPEKNRGLWPFNKKKTPPAIEARANDDMLAGTPALSAPGSLEGSARLRVTIGKKVHIGSGSVIDSTPGRTIVLTCGEIFQDAPANMKIEVDLYSADTPVTYVGRLLKHELEANIGLVSIATDAPVPVRRLAATGQEAVIGERAACIGCSGGEAPTREQVKVTEINKFEGPENIECSGVPVWGRAGGGLFNSRDELVGLCINAGPDNQHGVYTGLGPVRDLLDQCKLSKLARRKPLVDEGMVQAPPKSPSQTMVFPNAFETPQAPENLPEPFENTFAQVNVIAGGSDADTVPVPPMLEVPAHEAEAVIILRDPQKAGSQKVVIIHKPSQKFMNLLEAERSERMAASAMELAARDAPVVVILKDPNQIQSQRVVIIHKPSRQFTKFVDGERSDATVASVTPASSSVREAPQAATSSLRNRGGVTGFKTAGLSRDVKLRP